MIGGLAWQAEVNNYYQSITFELSGRFNICALSTQGRPKTKEFVTEYYVLSSDDGYTWTTYQSNAGQDQVQLLGMIISSSVFLVVVFIYFIFEDMLS